MTTDTAALREACAILNDHGYLTKSGKIRSSNLAEAVRMIIVQSVGYADQLEAERQRAENWKASFENERIRADKLAAHIEALKGEQVQVAITDDMAMAFHAATTDSALGRDDMEEIKAGLQAVQELFTAPQKPVVVLSDCDIAAVSHMAHWYSEEQCEAWVAGVEYAKKQMLATGIVVKDGE